MSDIEVIEIGNISGPQGPPGVAGPPGTAGVGVPPGGTTGQVLGKTSNADYITSWQNVSGGGGGPTGPAGGSLNGTYPNPGLTPAAVANLDLFTDVAKGVTPASGGGTSNFLRADGTWTTPPGGGGGGGPTGPAGGSLNGTYPNPTLSATAVADLNTFTSGAKGLAPASGGGSTSYLRADGAWAVPAGGGGGGGTVLDVTAIQAGNYAASANEFVLFDTTAASRTLALPPAPPNGTQVGARIVTLGVGNVVNVNCSGTDVFTKTGGPVVSNSVLVYINQSVLYVYDSGIWTTMSGFTPMSQTDTRYVQVANQVTLTGQGDLVLGAASGGVAAMDVTPAAHALWTPLSGVATADMTAITNNGATYQNDTELLVTVAASSTYEVNGIVSYDTGVNGDFRMSWNFPVGSTGFWTWYGYHVAWTTGVVSVNDPQPATAWSASQIAGGKITGTVLWLRIQGVLITSTTSGPFQFKWCQGTSDASPTQRKAQSYICLRRM